jgi:hypothetical protein
MGKVFAATEILLDAVSLLDGAADPSAGGGVARSLGSFYLRNQAGNVAPYQKTGALATAWQKWSQSFNWISVKAYGATGDGVTDDTTAIQNAINACNTQGGGVVYFPDGTYVFSQLALAGMAKVQLMGSGSGSTLKWTFNAGGVAGSGITLSAGTSQSRISMLGFDGSGLSNPAAGVTNHLIQIGTGAGGGVVETQIFQCQFKNAAAGHGDYVHVLGAAGNLVSRYWVVDNAFDGNGGNAQAAVGGEQGWEYGWIVDNYATGCVTEIRFVASADVNGNALVVMANEISHTSATRWAVRFEGGATTFITRLAFAENVVVGGFATINRCQYWNYIGNVITSGNFASADSVLRIFGNVQDGVVAANTIDRSSGASAGYCVSLEKSTNAPTRVRVGQNTLINEVTGAGAGFVQVIDATGWSIGSNQMRATDAGASVTYGVDVEAVTTNITDALIGPGNLITAGANTFAAAVRLLCNGADVKDCSVVGNQGDQIAYGLQLEIGGGGGTFSGVLLFGDNNFDSSTGDINRIGTTVALRIAGNAGTFGPNIWSGVGTPENQVSARVSSLFLRTDGGQATVVYYKETGVGNTGWLAIGGSMVPFGADSLGTLSTALFFAPGYTAAAGATEIQIPISRPGTIRNLRVQVATAGTGAATVTFTVRKNGVDTAIVATISNTATGLASDLADTISVAAGDLLSLKITKSAPVAVGQAQVAASLELV